STGDELVEAGEQPRSDQIRNLNAYSMSAQLRYMGIPFRYLGIVQDRQEDIRRVIEQGLQQDVLIMTGGVSVGEYDFVRDVFRDLGLEILFSKVAIRPGKPTVFARKDDRLVFGLPGNPVSTFVTFEIFVRAALGRLSGLDHPDLPRIRGFLQKDMHQSGGRTSFLPAWVTYENDRWEIAPLTWQGSGDIIGFARGNATVVFPGDRERMSQGEIAEALLLPDYWSRSRAFPQEGGRP
ncbi:MAG: molybdopterin molybdotransferase MoeA, partial [Acidobacteria bacterium]|nr:molybdopterin molybdotransferase MoeA [Acidobacteriota bacterium]